MNFGVSLEFPVTLSRKNNLYKPSCHNWHCHIDGDECKDSCSL